MRGRVLAKTGIFLFALLLVACLPDENGDTSAVPQPTTPDPVNGAAAPPEEPVFRERSWSATVVAEDLDIPWDMAILPGGNGMLVTERPGRLRFVDLRSGEVRLIAALPQVSHVGEGGLMGVELHPEFVENGFLYLYYTYGDGRNVRNRVSRFHYDGSELRDEFPVADDLPGGTTHNGGRLRFGPDGMLWILTGDAGVPALAQDSSSLAGKILRVREDGQVPPDNPDPASPVYSAGHRNPQGLDWHPVTGEPYATEHGPVAHDEVNRIVPGGNYGWPLVQRCSSDDPRFIDPVLCSGTETWAPSGASFLRDGPSDVVDSFFFAGLRGNFVRRIALSDGGVFVQETIIDDRYGRLRGMRAGPDGTLFVSTSNRDGRGRVRPGDDRILLLRLE